MVTSVTTQRIQRISVTPQRTQRVQRISVTTQRIFGFVSVSPTLILPLLSFLHSGRYPLTQTRSSSWRRGICERLDLTLTPTACAGYSFFHTGVALASVSGRACCVTAALANNWDAKIDPASLSAMCSFAAQERA